LAIEYDYNKRNDKELDKVNDDCQAAATLESRAAATVNIR
jgi:hypothetical protein